MNRWEFFAKHTLALLLGLNSLSVHAAEPDLDRGKIKAAMHTFMVELYRINPYLASEHAFTSKEGKKVVPEALDTINKRLKKSPSELHDSPGFRVSLDVLSDHLAKTKDVYDKGEYEYARTRLAGTTEMCASCHTQMPTIKKGSPFGAFFDIETKVNASNANFLFVTRHYDQALRQFDTLIRGYPKSGANGVELNEIYRRKLAIIARVKRNPTLGIESLTEDLRNKNLPADVRNNVNIWIDQMTKWKAEKADPANMSTNKLIDYVVTNMPKSPVRKITPADPNLLKLLYLSGLLYERLYKETNSDKTQELLYYLASCERSLSSLDWYSLSEIYLKECVVKYPKQPFSKKCYEAYNDGMIERYYGRTIPEYIQNSIDAMKEYL